MPIYEYACDVCGRQFERLIRPVSGRSPEMPFCPTCGTRAIRQLVSAFAVSSAERSQLNWNQGRKLAQKDLTEQRHAEMETVVHHHREHPSGD
jgi:putative FmdB family regulatory protein